MNEIMQVAFVAFLCVVGLILVAILLFVTILDRIADRKADREWEERFAAQEAMIDEIWDLGDRMRDDACNPCKRENSD